MILRILLALLLFPSSLAYGVALDFCPAGCDETQLQDIFDNNIITGPSTITMTADVDELAPITWGANDDGASAGSRVTLDLGGFTLAIQPGADCSPSEYFRGGSQPEADVATNSEFDNEVDAGGNLSMNNNELVFDVSGGAAARVEETSCLTSETEITFHFTVEFSTLTVDDQDDNAWPMQLRDSDSVVGRMEFSTDVGGDVVSYHVHRGDNGEAGNTVTLTGISAGIQYPAYCYYKEDAATGEVACKVWTWAESTTGGDDDNSGDDGIGTVQFAMPYSEWSLGTVLYDNFALSTTDQRTWSIVGMLIDDTDYIRVTNGVITADSATEGNYIVRSQDDSTTHTFDNVTFDGHDQLAASVFGHEIRSDANGIDTIIDEDNTYLQLNKGVRAYTSHADGDPQGNIVRRGTFTEMDQGNLSNADCITFGGGIKFDSGGSITERNDCTEYADTGIDSVMASNITHRYNKVYGSVPGGDMDYYKIDTTQENTGIDFYGNTCRDTDGVGLYIGEASATICANDWYGVGRQILFQPSTADAGSLVIESNISQKGGQLGLHPAFAQLVSARITSMNRNIYFDKIAATGFSDIDNVPQATFALHKAAINDDADSLEINPLFRDAPSGDFRLSTGSPGRNLGTLGEVCANRIANQTGPENYPDNVVVVQDIRTSGAHTIPKGAAASQ